MLFPYFLASCNRIVKEKNGNDFLRVNDFQSDIPFSMPVLIAPRGHEKTGSVSRVTRPAVSGRNWGRVKSSAGDM